MLLPVEWLREFVEFSAGEDELAQILTSRGLEVESVKKTPAGGVIEIELTPNRGDCASVLGVAREVAAHFGLPLLSPSSSYSETGPGAESRYGIRVEPSGICPIYHLKLIRDIKVGESPEWLKDRLSASGIRPLNSVVDVTNYVMLETGQPLHAFDASLIGGNTVEVRGGRDGESITVLDGSVHKLSPEDIVISCDGTPVALGGVTGGLDSAVKSSTGEILLEAAYFRSRSISATERRLGLKTEASYRFSRGVDPGGLLRALDRAAHLLAEISGGSPAPGVLSHDEFPEKETWVRVTLSDINSLLGTELKPDRVVNLLEALGFKTEGGRELSVRVPSYRRDDIRRGVDIIEEIARSLGYDKIPSRLPRSSVSSALARKPDPFTRAGEVLGAMGYSRCVTLPLCGSENCVSAGFDPGSLILIDNPVSVNMDALRPSLLPGLISTIKYNINQGVQTLKFFERGPVFINSGKEHSETRHLAFAAASDDFLEVKSGAVSILDALRQGYELEYPEESGVFKPGRYARVRVNGLTAGEMGIFGSGFLKAMGVPGRSLGGGYLALDKLDRSSASFARFSPWSPYPSVFRDISIVVEDSLTHSDIYDTIKSAGGRHLKRVRLSDVFTGKSLETGKKSMTYRLEFNSDERTLTSDEVEGYFGKVVEELKRACGASLRQ